MSVIGAAPAVMVLGAPFILLACFGLLHRPDSEPVISAVLDHRWLHEGQGTTSRLALRDGEDVEHVARLMAQTPYVALHPSTGLAAGLADALPTIEIGPRRWGRRVLGEELVCLTTPWAGYRWGPVRLPGDSLRVLPHTRRFDSRTDTPRPVGLVGVNRSPRLGAGGEFSDIRPFQPREPPAPGGGGGGVRRHPAVPARRPAAPDQLAGLGAQPRAARHHLACRGGQ